MREAEKICMLETCVCGREKKRWGGVYIYASMKVAFYLGKKKDT
jgi:hypothetical protein